MKTNLSSVKSEVENYAKESNLTELQVVEKLKDFYFNKKVNENIKLYKRGKKKVSEINRISSINQIVCIDRAESLI